MLYKKLFWIFLLLLTACQPVSSTQPISTPTLWQVEYTPSLQWMGKDFNTCIQEQSNFQVIVSEKPVQSLMKNGADFSILWGYPEDPAEHTFLLGKDELIFIIHPDNPLQEISLEQAQKIYNGEYTNWGFANDPQNEASSPITVWRYPDGHEIQQLYEQFIQAKSSSPQTTYMLAPSPKAMMEAVSEDPNAIGMIPRKWLDNGVKLLKISDKPAHNNLFPIVVMLNDSPIPEQEAWLLCLQEKIAAP